MKYLSYSLLILLSLVGTQVYGLNLTAYNLTCESNVNTTTYGRGDPIYVCVHFVNEANPSLSLRMIYSIKVDDYARLSIAGAQPTFLSTPYNASNTVIAMQAYHNNSTSPGVYFIRKNQTAAQVYTILSAVVELKDGIVQSVTWDNGCYSCEIDACDISYNATDSLIYQNCWAPTCSAINSTTNTSACDPKIYVSFVGTDKNGLKMESAGLRISSFRQYSITDIWASAQKLLNDQYNSSAQSYCSVPGNCKAQTTTTTTTSTTTSSTTTTTTTTPAPAPTSTETTTAPGPTSATTTTPAPTSSETTTTPAPTSAETTTTPAPTSSETSASSSTPTETTTPTSSATVTSTTTTTNTA